MKCTNVANLGEVFLFHLRGEQKDGELEEYFWANIYMSCEDYSILAASDCGTFYYEWSKTPEAESFPSLLRRLNKGYLLEKLGKESEFDLKKTISAAQKIVAGYLKTSLPCLDADKDLKAAIYDIGCLVDESITTLDGFMRRVDSILSVHLYAGMRYVVEYSLKEEEYGAVFDFPAKTKRFVDILYPKLQEMARHMEAAL